MNLFHHLPSNEWNRKSYEKKKIHFSFFFPTSHHHLTLSCQNKTEATITSHKYLVLVQVNKLAATSSRPADLLLACALCESLNTQVEENMLDQHAVSPKRWPTSLLASSKQLLERAGSALRLDCRAWANLFLVLWAACECVKKIILFWFSSKNCWSMNWLCVVLAMTKEQTQPWCHKDYCKRYATIKSRIPARLRASPKCVELFLYK